LGVQRPVRKTKDGRMSAMTAVWLLISLASDARADEVLRRVETAWPTAQPVRVTFRQTTWNTVFETESRAIGWAEYVSPTEWRIHIEPAPASAVDRESKQLRRDKLPYRPGREFEEERSREGQRVQCSSVGPPSTETIDLSKPRDRFGDFVVQALCEFDSTLPFLPRRPLNSTHWSFETQRANEQWIILRAIPIEPMGSVSCDLDISALTFELRALCLRDVTIVFERRMDFGTIMVLSDEPVSALDVLSSIGK